MIYPTDTHYSPHFSKAECLCTGFTKQTGCGCDGHAGEMDLKLFPILEHMRREAGAPITITSAFRCPARNSQVGGASQSQHMRGTAVDFVIGQENGNPVWSTEKVRSFLTHHYPEVSHGLYDWGSHMDVRDNGPAYWDRRTVKHPIPVWEPYVAPEQPIPDEVARLHHDVRELQAEVEHLKALMLASAEHVIEELSPNT